MRFGPFDVSTITHGTFRLDGGAVFGTVPKAIWSKLLAPDEDNRVLFAARSLVVRREDRVVLIDAGMGDRWTDKLRRIYDVRQAEDEAAGLDPASVTDIILTHLHFDHARGIFQARPGDEAEADLRYPGARILVQGENYENAKSPNVRERASYIAEDTQRLERAQLVLTSGSQEVLPGVWVHATNGHTRGHQWIELRSGAGTVAFPGDIVPTSKHLPLPYLMGYDISAETLLGEKDALLARAVDKRWTVVFCHDPEIAAARVERNEKGQYVLGDVRPL